MTAGWLLSLVALALPIGALVSTYTQFTDVTATDKVHFLHSNSPTKQKYLPETMGGGVAVFDFDNDGRLDLFFTNGAQLRDPMPGGALSDKSDPRYWNRLFHQNPDGTFTDVTEHAGVSAASTGSYSMGVAVGDYDNDGFEDLFVTGFGSNILYHNNGDGTFTDVTKRAGLEGGGWSTSAGFFDYNNDGKLDLFVCRYLKWTFENSHVCRDFGGIPAYCHPNVFDTAQNLLYRNNGDGTFTDVSRQAGVAQGGNSLGVAFADYDRDGWTDIFVANDSRASFLYRNNHDGTFREVALESGTAVDEDGRFYAGMGADFSDFNNDGWPDIVVTDLSEQRYLLYKNNGDGSFSDVSNQWGLAQISQLYSGWGVKFIDYDNDGWKDLFVAQGHVQDQIEKMGSFKYKEPPLLLQNSSTRFTAVNESAGPAFREPWAGRGAAFGDLDNNGDIDIVVANCGETAYILRNNGGNRNHSIQIGARGTHSNRDGIGAVIKVTAGSGLTQYYTVNTAGSYLSASDKRVLVGLGSDTTATVQIQWPGGRTQTLQNVRAGQNITITEPN